jgi:DnaK suppressor protein
MTARPQILSPSDLLQLKQRLYAQAQLLAQQDHELRARLAAEESATANTFVAGVEGAMFTEADEEVIALMHHEQTEQADIAAALKRMNAGDYGLCGECGDAIGLQRLLVLPQASLCVGCQDMAEHRKGR